MSFCKVGNAEIAEKELKGLLLLERVGMAENVTLVIRVKRVKRLRNVLNPSNNSNPFNSFCISQR